MENSAHVVANDNGTFLDDRKHCARSIVGTFKRVVQQCFSMR